MHKATIGQRPVMARDQVFPDGVVWRASFDRQVYGIEIGISWTRTRPKAEVGAPSQKVRKRTVASKSAQAEFEASKGHLAPE